MAILREINGHRYFYWTDDAGLDKKLKEMQLPDRTYYPGEKIIGWEYCLPVIFAGFDGEYAYFELTEYAPKQADLFHQNEIRLFEPAAIIGNEIILGRRSQPEICFSVNHAAKFYIYDSFAGGWRYRGRPSHEPERIEVIK